MFDSTVLRKLRLPVILTLAAVFVVSGYYLYRLKSQGSYLNSSNLRLLTTIASHIDAWVDRQERIFGNVVRAPDPNAARWKRRSDSSRRWDVAKGPRPSEPPEIDQPAFFRDSRGQLWLELKSSFGDQLRVRFDEGLLEPMGETLQKDVFDVVMLSTSRGTVLARAGNQDISVADLGTLVGQDDFARAATHTSLMSVKLSGSEYRLFMRPCCRELLLRGMPEVEPSAGSSVQPTLGDPRNTNAPTNTRTPTPTARRAEPGLVLAGLVSSATLNERRLSISFSTMLVSAGLLLILVVSWPFIKLALIGPRQRVALLDVLLIGVSSLLILLLGTLYLLDFYSYLRLRSETDRRLRAFSVELQSNMRRELAAAYDQLGVLRKAGLVLKGEKPEVADVLAELREVDFSFYPFFETFFLADESGAQKLKWSIRSDPTPLVSVEDRDYFKQVTENGTWSVPVAGDLPRLDGVALASNRSTTRMQAQAVLATATGSPELPVAALAIPMISLIDPVLAPGFGFAVIEDDGPGRVLFHSDWARNTLEQFFPETNFDRRLRSAVQARRAELLDIQYWGRDYRAHVSPIAGLPWSLVTFYDKDLIRSVNVDLIVTTLLFMVLYAFGYVAACLFVLLRPANRATWLWPLPGGLYAYVELILFYVALIGAVGVAIYFGDTRSASATLFLPVFFVPPLAWLMTYLRLKAERHPVAQPAPTDRPRADVPGFPDPQPNTLLPLAYICAAALLLVITAVLPTVASFKVAQSVQVMPFLKYTQRRLAIELEDRRRRVESDLGKLSDRARGRDLSAQPAGSNQQTSPPRTADLPGSPCLDLPSRIVERRRAIDCPQLRFEDGRLRKRPILPVDIYFADRPPGRTVDVRLGKSNARFGTMVAEHGVGNQRPERTESTFVEVLEPFLPYYSESSVAMRELLHDESNDNTHRWTREPGGQLVMTGVDHGEGPLTITSTVPAFGTFRGLSIVFVLVGGLVIAVAVFIAHRVFLMDMPLWSPTAGGFTTAGQSTFVVCRKEALRAIYLADRRYAKVDLAAQDDWNSALTELDRVLPGEPIVIDHFEYGADDRQLSEKKLWLLEQLVQARRRRLIVLSAIGPAPLIREARTGQSGSQRDKTTSVEQRWASLLTSSFVVIDVDPRFESDASRASSGPGAVTRWEKALGTEWRWRWKYLPAYLYTRQHRAVRNALEREYAGNPYLLPVYEDLSRMITRRGEEGFDTEELLEEFGARAASYYEGLWACCSPVEKLVLEHLGEEGFANYKDGRAVRRLISRGLIRRDPHLRLMNETFRRFVISTRCKKEVDEVEQRTRKSAWDHFQRPFVIALAIALVLFVATQKSRFDTMMALIVGMTGIIPSLLKLAGFLLGEKPVSPIAPS